MHDLRQPRKFTPDACLMDNFLADLTKTLMVNPATTNPVCRCLSVSVSVSVSLPILPARSQLLSALQCPWLLRPRFRRTGAGGCR
jgi:hypothetical protein